MKRCFISIINYPFLGFNNFAAINPKRYMLNRLIALTVCFFCLPALLLAQKSSPEPLKTIPSFTAEIKAADLTIDGEKHNGFVTPFDFPDRNVEKGWWKYISGVARVKDRKTYWILSVPPKKGESNVPVVMYSSIKRTGNASSLTLALNASEMDAAVKKDYMAQARNFLWEFKAGFYRDYIQQQITAAEKTAKATSKRQQKHLKIAAKLKKSAAKEQSKSGNEAASGKNSPLSSKLAATEAEAAKAGTELARIEAHIELLKKTLLGYIEKSG